MSADRRPLLPTALVALLGVSTGAAAWLGVATSPSRPAESAWQGFLASTVAAGTLAFSSVTTISGASDSLERSTGAVDFSARAATEVTVVRGPGSPPQWIESVVVGGRAYERPGTEDPGSSRFSGEWTPLGSFVLVPFAPLTDGRSDGPPVGGPSLRRVGTASVGGVATTVYQLAPVGITCVRGDGDQRSENVTSSIWVDPSGRIVKFENLTAVSVAGVQTALLTVSKFGRFGGPVPVDPPQRVSGAGAAPAPASDPLAGCLVTPG